MEASLKVSRAVTRAAFKHPFFGSCMLRILVAEDMVDKGPATMYTNGKEIRWFRKFVDTLTEDETLAVLAHEVMHVLLLHCMPHGPSFPDANLRNIAMDIVINQILKDSDLPELPKGCVEPETRFEGMTWKAVYNIIKDEKDYKDKADQMQPGEGDVQPDAGGMSEAEQADVKAKVEEMTIQASESAEARSPGSTPQSIIDQIRKIRTPKVDWREYLQETMECRFPQDYTMRRPNRKFLSGYDLYLPSMEGRCVGKIGIHIDSSGSVHKEEKEQFLGELNEISMEYNPEEIIIFHTDCKVSKVDVYERGDTIESLDVSGGGGTDFTPTFDHIRDNDIEIQQLIVFSDMEVGDFCFPDEEPPYPVLFISTREMYAVPFGECIQVHPDR